MNTTPLLQQAQQAQTQLLAPGAPFERVPVEHHGAAVLAYRNAFPHLPALLQAARAHGPAEFIVHGDQRWTFDRFFEAVDALAGRLQQQGGVQAGERVAIAMRNRPEWAIALVACALIGAVAVPVNSFGLGEELRAALDDTTPVWLICDPERLERLGGTAALPAGCQCLLVDGSAAAAGPAAWADWVAPGAPAVQAAAPAPGDPALILFTSGATSRAKGVLSSQRAVCQALFNIDFIGALAGMTSPAAVQKLMGSGLKPTTLTAVPLFHVSGLHAQLLISLRHGRRLVFMQRWNPQDALDLIQRERITQFNGAPSMVQQLLGEPRFHDPAVTGTLMGLGFGGAGLSQRLIDETLAARPDSLSGIGFGMTETNGAGAAASGRLFAARPDCAGLPSPLVEIRIVSPDGTALPVGEAGEICVRGVTLMERYWQQPEATADALRGGWLHTGDVGCLEADGYLRIVDRIKDIINRNGEKIAAAEVESCLLQHPRVDEAAVFAVADARSGEAVAAVVSLKPGPLLSAEELCAHVRAHLAAHKVPARLQVHEGPLPRTATGKVLKKALRDSLPAAQP
jgi:long-chain acyl-CoA synthetase